MRPYGWREGGWWEEKKSPEEDARELAWDARAFRKARAPAARRVAQRLQGGADAAQAAAEALNLQARLVDLTIWEMKVVKESRKSCKIYIYWIASWREGDRMRNCTWGAPGRLMPKLPGKR